MVKIDDSKPPVAQVLPFSGQLQDGLSSDVYIHGQAAAVVGSGAQNYPAHTPIAPGVAFVNPPSNRGRVTSGSSTVFINGKAAARSGDSAETCSDPAPNRSGSVVVNSGEVYFG